MDLRHRNYRGQRTCQTNLSKQREAPPIFTPVIPSGVPKDLKQLSAQDVVWLIQGTYWSPTELINLHSTILSTVEKEA